jgi:Uma2 family endonuclease
MSPDPNIEHQGLGFLLAKAIHAAAGLPESLPVFLGVNVSDRVEGWRENYRVPDVALYLPDNPAQDCDTHWSGGPDLGVEILSEGDRGRDKLDFYGKVNTRELMIIDRDPWALELNVLKRKKLRLTGRSTPDDPVWLESTVLPVAYRLIAGTPRPVIEVRNTDTDQVWRV